VRRELRFVRDYLREVGDRRKILFPMTFLTESPLLNDIDAKLAPLTATNVWPDWCGDWGYIMDKVCKGCVNDRGLRDACVDEDVYCPIPWFLRQKPLRANTVMGNACAWIPCIP
jgi:hypothetical protein